MSFPLFKNFKLFYITIAIAASCPFPFDAFASTSANLRVSAVVLPAIHFKVNQLITNYRVNGDDLRKGYVDLPNSISVTLKTNVKNNIPFILDNWGTGKILIRERGTTNYTEGYFVVNSSGHHTAVPTETNYDLRILLPAQAQEGAYPLNISIDASI